MKSAKNLIALIESNDSVNYKLALELLNAIKDDLTSEEREACETAVKKREIEKMLSNAYHMKGWNSLRSLAKKLNITVEYEVKEHGWATSKKAQESKEAALKDTNTFHLYSKRRKSLTNGFSCNLLRTQTFKVIM